MYNEVMRTLWIGISSLGCPGSTKLWWSPISNVPPGIRTIVGNEAVVALPSDSVIDNNMAAIAGKMGFISCVSFRLR